MNLRGSASLLLALLGACGRPVATDPCRSGVCVGANPVPCTAIDQCHVAGACDPATGVCSNPAQADNTPCDDHNRCKLNESCQSGVCSGAAVTCTASDQCHLAGTCDPASGPCHGRPLCVPN